MTKFEAFSLSDVVLTDHYCVNAFSKEIDYLLSFDTEKLLAGFRETAGIDTKGVTRYPGWENMLIGGHTLGHYLTACAQAYESASIEKGAREELLKKITVIIDGLRECQEKTGTGFIFGATILPGGIEQQFDNIEKGMTNIITEAWVPWYTMHKIISGLVSVACLKEKVAAQALKVASDLGDWAYKRVSSWDEDLHNRILGIEYGGMNDCMYEVYKLTGKKEHLNVAMAFDETALFKRVSEAKIGANVLNNHHANTTIPKFIGALNRYLVLGETEYLSYVEKFWEMVTKAHSYITGGNSEWEHFGLDGVLDKERTNCNCETCNIYNMLKMTKLLFMITGEAKYADWYENAFINSILSSQNPITGMTTYFQPMAGGYFKTYSDRHNKFWCCTGSGMENFSKLGESFYFHTKKDIVVNQYISSRVTFNGSMFEMITDIPSTDKAVFRVGGNFRGKILFRLPDWLAGDVKVCLNEKEVSFTKSKGYAVLSGPFKAGTEIEITLPMQVKAYNLPDGENTYAFKYGPVVLSALLGTDKMETTTTGVDVTIAKEKVLSGCYFTDTDGNVKVNHGTVKEYIDNINSNLVRQKKTMKFVLKGTDAKLTYVPHYSQHTERYALYITLTE